MNGIHEVTGSIPVWSTNSKLLILNERNRSPTPSVEPRGRFIAIENPIELYLFEAYAAVSLDGTQEWNMSRAH